MMKLVAIVDAFLPFNVHVDHDDGSFECFDTTRLRIVEPASMTGQVMNVDHTRSPPAGSPWREPGTVLGLTCDDDDDTTSFPPERDTFSDRFRIETMSRPPRRA